MKTQQDRIVRIICTGFISSFLVLSLALLLFGISFLLSTPCYAATDEEIRSIDWTGYSLEDVDRILSEDITEESLMTLEQKQTCLIGEMRDFYQDFNKMSIGIKYDALCAISALETGYFSSDVCRNLNNVGGIAGYNGYASYSTKLEGIQALSELLTSSYLDPEGCYYEGNTIVDVSKHYNQSTHWISLYVKIRLDMEKRSDYNHKEALKELEPVEEVKEPELELPCIEPSSIEEIHKNMFILNERICVI